jgi:hypothetical protein
MSAGDSNELLEQAFKDLLEKLKEKAKGRVLPRCHQLCVAHHP